MGPGESADKAEDHNGGRQRLMGQFVMLLIEPGEDVSGA
jgi:hypothetical protein